MREEVEGVLEREDVGGDGQSIKGLSRLQFQFLHGCLPSPRGSLVGGNYHSSNAGEAM